MRRMKGRWSSHGCGTFELDIYENMVSGKYKVHHADLEVILPVKGIVIDKGEEMEVAMSITVQSHRSTGSSQSVAFSGTLLLTDKSEIQYLHTSELASNLEVLQQGILVLEPDREMPSFGHPAEAYYRTFLDFVVSNYTWPLRPN